MILPNWMNIIPNHQPVMFFFPTTMVSFFRAETPRASTAMSREAGRERRDEQRSGLETGFTKGERSKDTYMTVTCFAYSR
jgi:hypothetical protein